MKRRDFIRSSLVVGAAAVAPAQETPSVPPLPRRDRIRVAFLLGPDTNVIDTAGPWEVFQDVMVMKSGTHTNPFELVTVGPSRDPLSMTAGLVVTPAFTFADAPPVNVVVIPAQRAGDAGTGLAAGARGARRPASCRCAPARTSSRAPACSMGSRPPLTTISGTILRNEFPKVRLQRGPRFVDNGRIATSGGLTSGIDLALHVVERYFDMDTARATARYLEHDAAAGSELKAGAPAHGRPGHCPLSAHGHIRALSRRACAANSCASFQSVRSARPHLARHVLCPWHDHAAS